MHIRPTAALCARIAALVLATWLTQSVAWAKLPPPDDAAKAKAAEAAAKAAHAGRLDNYKLCLAMDRVAAAYHAQHAQHADAKIAGKAASAAVATPTPGCADPGAFAYTPPEAKPIEAAGAHSPTATAASPPSTTTPAAAIQGKK